MKSATQNLEDDHVIILQLTDVMESMVNQHAKNIQDIETVLLLIRNYADGFHHAKEENLLFPLMSQKGFSTEQGPIAVMLSDHEQGRKFAGAIDAGIKQFSAGDAAAVNMIYENMIGYSQLLKSHIAKENNVLFRMADKVLSDAEQEQLLTEFGEIEQKEEFKTKVAAYKKDIERLKLTYKA